MLHQKHQIFKIRFKSENKIYVLKYGNIEHEREVLNKLKDIKNVQQIIFAGITCGDKDCIITPFYGNSLDKIGSISESSAIWKHLQIALSEIHKRGVTHSDIRPQNICLSAEQEVTLIDFGLSTEIGSQSPLGTYVFSSTDQMLEFPASSNYDFQSLLYTKYYLVNGSLPWNNNDDIETLFNKKKLFLKSQKEISPKINLKNQLLQSIDCFIPIK